MSSGAPISSAIAARSCVMVLQHHRDVPDQDDRSQDDEDGAVHLVIRPVGRAS